MIQIYRYNNWCSYYETKITVHVGFADFIT
jgi:hypothetical protein